MSDRTPAYGSRAEVAAYLGVTPRTVDRLLIAGTLTRRRVRSAVRIEWAEVDRYMGTKRRRAS